jgi:hypothetical protein
MRVIKIVASDMESDEQDAGAIIPRAAVASFRDSFVEDKPPGNVQASLPDRIGIVPLVHQWRGSIPAKTRVERGRS